ncbi:MAG: dephospho-CoA kinase [Myxococcales bacterium]|nr:dephospho-CoA kinase [Myxococcales bacterium]
MDVYGLTGGIGSGKSAVADLLEQYGVPVVSADELARVVVARGSEGLARVVEAFGDGVLDDRGELDRRKMASIVFQDPAKRQQLEGILHPRIRERFEQVLDAIEKSGHAVAVYEVPLLFEKNLQSDMKAVILVTADESIRIQRVCARDGVTEAEVRARMAVQLPEDVKRKRADYVIVNDGGPDDLRREVEFLLARFLRVGPLRPTAAVTRAPAVAIETGAPAEPMPSGGTARLFGFPPAAPADDE